MFVKPDNLPGDARIWIYQCNRELSANEEQQILSLAEEFLNSWTAHNQALKASFEIKHHLFLIIMIDQNFASASGCSIDKSIHFIQRLESEFLISLLDRQLFAIRMGDKINLIKRKDFERMIEKEITPESIVFNNLIQTKSELDTKWEISVKDSWHGAISGISN
jgi:hypothetical protein